MFNDILHILDSLEDTILLQVRFGLVILQTLGIFLYLNIIYVRNLIYYIELRKVIVLLVSCIFGGFSIVNILSRLYVHRDWQLFLPFVSLGFQVLMLIISLVLGYYTIKRHFCKFQWEDSRKNKEVVYFAMYLRKSTANILNCI